MNSYYNDLKVGNHYLVKKIVLETEDISIYICQSESDNLLYTVNRFKTDSIKEKAAEICQELNHDIHRDFIELFTHESDLYVVFEYHNGIELRKYMANNNPDLFERLDIGEKLIEKAISLNVYPPMLKITAMNIGNTVILGNDAVNVNFYLDFNNTPYLITDAKYISATGNILYELFSDVKNCPNQIDAFVVKAAFGRFETLERMALEYSAIKNEVLDFFMDVERPEIKPIDSVKEFKEEKETKKSEPLILNWFKGKEKPGTSITGKKETKEIEIEEIEDEEIEEMTEKPEESDEFEEIDESEEPDEKEQEEEAEEPAKSNSLAEEISKQLLKSSFDRVKPKEESEKEPVKPPKEAPVIIKPVRKHKEKDKEQKDQKPKEIKIPFIRLAKKKDRDFPLKKKPEEKPAAPASKEKLVYPSANKKPSVNEKPKAVRKQLRFPVKTVLLFFLLFAVMVFVAYGLINVFRFFDDRNVQEVNNDISDDNNKYEISVEGHNGTRIETTQPGGNPVETTQPVTTTAETTTATQTATTSSSQTTGANGSKGVREYIVQAGDYLRKISKDFYGVDEYYHVIVEYNNLQGTDLTVGQKLYIPPLVDEDGTEFELYVVQSGDYLIEISRKVYNDGNKYKIIQEYNNLKDDDPIVVGQILKIPLK
jgi:nucleoid-associated protein YgaU